MWVLILSHSLKEQVGLYGMNERAELVNGNVNIDTQIGKGTIITLEIPI